MKLGNAIKLGALTVFLLAVVVSYTIPGIELGAIFEFLYYRVFDIPNEVLVEYFSAFPVSLPHNWPFGFFGDLFRSGSERPLQNYYAVAELVRGNLLSTSNAMFLGDAWADYSWVGVLFFPFAAGAVVRWIDIYAERNGKTDEWACLVAGCAFGILTLLSTAFTTALITGGLALIPFASLLFRKKRVTSTVVLMGERYEGPDR